MEDYNPIKHWAYLQHQLNTLSQTLRNILPTQDNYENIIHMHNSLQSLLQSIKNFDRDQPRMFQLITKAMRESICGDTQFWELQEPPKEFRREIVWEDFP
jgi:hypothetical protein